MQVFSASSAQLFVWRLLLGFALGADYVASEAMVAELSPPRKRGLLLSILCVAWTLGYILAFIAGYLLRNNGPAAWRMALLTCAVPSMIAFILRLGAPESPVWLSHRGYIDKARQTVTKLFGSDVALPLIGKTEELVGEPISDLFRHPMYRNTIVGCLFFTAQVIPGFALGTFAPLVLRTLHVTDEFTGALIYNVVLLVAVVVGMLICDRVPRRQLLISTFVLVGALLSVLAFWRSAPAAITTAVFAGFAFVMSLASVLQVVYPPELFPTELRGRGLGLVFACSMIGAAVSTFLLPIVVEGFGIYVALDAFILISLSAAVVCKLWAPETLGARLV